MTTRETKTTGRDACHFKTEAASRAELFRIVEELETVRFRLLGVRASLPSPQVETLHEDGEEGGVGPKLLSAIDCVLADQLEPAIRDLTAAAIEEDEERPL
jgi:hypothetical protein